MESENKGTAFCYMENNLMVYEGDFIYSEVYSNRVMLLVKDYVSHKVSRVVVSGAVCVVKYK